MDGDVYNVAQENPEPTLVSHIDCPFVIDKEHGLNVEYGTVWAREEEGNLIVHENSETDVYVCSQFLQNLLCV